MAEEHGERQIGTAGVIDAAEPAMGDDIERLLAAIIGVRAPADLTALYPQFYWNSVSSHIQTAIRYLNVTSSGRQWIANLYSNVFRAERET